MILVIEEQAASIFTADALGQVITTDEDLRRALEEERDPPQFHVVRDHEPASPN